MTELHEPEPHAPPPGPWENQPGAPQAKWAVDSETARPSFRAAPADGGSGAAPSSHSTTVIETLLTAAERPEIVIGAAFVGGVLLAMIFKRLGSSA